MRRKLVLQCSHIKSNNHIIYLSVYYALYYIIRVFSVSEFYKFRSSSICWSKIRRKVVWHCSLSKVKFIILWCILYTSVYFQFLGPINSVVSLFIDTKCLGNWFDPAHISIQISTNLLTIEDSIELIYPLRNFGIILWLSTIWEVKFFSLRFYKRWFYFLRMSIETEFFEIRLWCHRHRYRHHYLLMNSPYKHFRWNSGGKSQIWLIEFLCFHSDCSLLAENIWSFDLDDFVINILIN